MAEAVAATSTADMMPGSSGTGGTSGRDSGTDGLPIDAVEVEVELDVGRTRVGGAVAVPVPVPAASASSGLRA